MKKEINKKKSSAVESGDSASRIGLRLEDRRAIILWSVLLFVCGMLFGSFFFYFASEPAISGPTTVAQGVDPGDDLQNTDVLVVTADDALEMRTLSHLRALYKWADGVPLFFSEIGVPDASEYSSLMEKYFSVIGAHGSHTALWAVGEHWGDYDVVPYDAITLADLSGSDVFNRNLAGTFTGDSVESPDEIIHALNLAGGEFTLDADASGLIDGYGDKYFYHEVSEIWAVIAAKGYEYVRYPVRLERLFENTDGSWQWREGDLGLLSQVMASARAAGIEIVFDLHNYGAMQIDGEKVMLGEPGFEMVDFQEMLVEVADFSREYSDVIMMIGIMNEPKNVEVKEWEDYAQRAVQTLRDAQWSGMIEVPTGNWQGVQDVPRIHDAPWIVDPLDNFVYGVHMYFDLDYSGTYRSSYESDNAQLKEIYAPGEVIFDF